MLFPIENVISFASTRKVDKYNYVCFDIKSERKVSCKINMEMYYWVTYILFYVKQKSGS